MAVCKLFIAVASLVLEHRFRALASLVLEHRFRALAQ